MKKPAIGALLIVLIVAAAIALRRSSATDSGMVTPGQAVESGITAAGMPADGGESPAAPVTEKPLVARIHPAYAGLKSYADSGTVTEEVPGFTNRSTFKTYYRTPGDFFLEFRGISSDYTTGIKIPLDQHLVFWM